MISCETSGDIKKKLLLIEPPFYRLFKDTFSLTKYPLSLGYLAASVIENTDWQVMVYNADFNPIRRENVQNRFLRGQGFTNYLRNLNDSGAMIWQDVRRTISEFRPSVVGITSKSQNFASACMVARIAKELDQSTIVILGGPYASMIGGQALECNHIDVCVRGEGEITIVELLTAIGTNVSLDGIRGVSYRREGRIVDNKPRAFVTDLDSLHFPAEYAREVLKDYDRYPIEAFAFIFATRGCPHNCFFCGSRYIWSRKVRFRSPSNVVREISNLRSLGIGTIHFDDDTFGVNRQYLRELCSKIAQKCPGLAWSCEINASLVDDETISVMKSAGCYAVQIGIESGNDRILQAIRKNITVEQARSACRLIKKHDLQLATFFIVGFPQETEETLRDTIRVMEEIDPDVLVYSIFTPYPGTEAFEFCKDRGLIERDFDTSLYNHQSPANSFIIDMDRERFRKYVSKIDDLIERKNAQKSIIKATETESSVAGIPGKLYQTRTDLEHLRHSLGNKLVSFCASRQVDHLFRKEHALTHSGRLP